MTLFDLAEAPAAPAAGRPSTVFGDPQLPERFWNKVTEAQGGCWLWSAETDRDGYGRFKVNGVKQAAHHVAYQLLVGPIPSGLQLDHLCRVRNCVQPAHLEPVTNRVNALRGRGPTAVNATKTHCPQGHPYSPENTRERPCVRRMCRTCDRARKRKHGAAE
ncbi:HNH endonuclease signature motif containing protein [Streptomyces griseoincarnatus]